MKIKEILYSYNLKHITELADCVNESLEITLTDNDEVIGGILCRSLCGTLDI